MDYSAISNWIDTYFAIIVAFFPFLLLLIDAGLKNMMGLSTETRGADAAFCGVGVLASVVLGLPWVSPRAQAIAFLILGAHVLFWALVLAVASKGIRLASKAIRALQSVMGALVMYSAARAAEFYMRGAGR